MFRISLKKHVPEGEERSVVRADDPEKKITLNRNNPKKYVEYYYQVRSNLTHRGKASPNDYGTVLNSLSELLPIFWAVLRNAFEESRSAE